MQYTKIIGGVSRWKTGRQASTVIDICGRAVLSWTLQTYPCNNDRIFETQKRHYRNYFWKLTVIKQPHVTGLLQHGKETMPTNVKCCKFHKNILFHFRNL
jgi:hypothetical protein